MELKQFDTDHYALNTEAGTIDLRTGIDRPPNPHEYITKITACAAARREPRFGLVGIPRAHYADDVELQQFLQRFAGYCCNGDTRECTSSPFPRHRS